MQQRICDCPLYKGGCFCDLDNINEQELQEITKGTSQTKETKSRGKDVK